MANYTELPEQELREEKLLNNPEFMTDIRGFLAERNNEIFSTNKETFAAYLEHMRKQSVNETQAVGDLWYAQEADDISKIRFAKITNVFDRLQGEEDWLTAKGWRKLKDYGEGLAKSPSTWLGLLTGGGGKAAAQAAQQGIKWTTRRYLGQVLKSSLFPIGIEATTGVVQGAASEQTRKVLGLEGDWKRGALIGGLGGVAAGAFGGGLSSALSIRSGRKAGEVLKQGKEAQAEAAEQAAKTTEETLAADVGITIGKKTIKTSDAVAYFSKELDALDKLQVSAGTATTDRIGEIPREQRNAIIAAAIDMADKLKFDLDDPALRITQRLHDRIESGQFSILELQDIALKYNLSIEDVANVFIADVSNAAKLMRQMGTLRQAATGSFAATKQIKSAEHLQRLLVEVSPGAADEATQLAQGHLYKIANMGKKGLETWRGLDKLRLALMTSQITTTIRNATNVGIRLPLHMIEFAMTGGSWKNALSIPYNLFDKGSAEGLAIAFDDAAPKQFSRLIRSAMDIEYQMGANTVLAKIGRGINILNTYVDNTVKKAVLLGEFRKIAGGTKQLNEVLSSKGGLKRWLVVNDKAVREAMDETLSVVYQKGYRTGDKAGAASNMAARFIRVVAHSPYSPLLTQFVPFPRYLANQTEFIYKHMPLVGMLAPIIKGESKAVIRKRMAQQVSGLALLYGAMQLKVLQGPNVKWDQYKDMFGPEKGTVSNIAALLGPFAIFNVVVDLIYRMSEGKIKHLVPIKPKGQDVSVERFDIPETRDMFKAVTGLGRAGTGLYMIDTLIKDLIEFADSLNSDNIKTSLGATNKILGRFVANYINSGFVPVGMFRDLQGTFDPEGRVIMDNDNVDVWQYLINQTIRALPNTKAVRNTEEFLGIPPALSSTLHWLRGDQRPQQFPMGGGPRTRRTPLVRQWTGVTPSYGLEGMPPVEEELTRLGITRRAYFPYSSKGPLFRNTHKMLMGKWADEYLTPIINSPQYRSLAHSRKRYRLMEEIKKGRAETAKKAEEIARAKVGDEYDRYTFERLPRIRRKAILELYREMYEGKDLIKNKDWSRGLYLNKLL